MSEIKNGDMPSQPMGNSANGSVWTASDLGNGYAEQCKPAFGLTKREHFAAMAMQGLLANSAHYAISTIELTKESVELADVLLEELDKCQ